MKGLFSILIYIYALPAIAAEGIGSLTGKVTDSGSGQPLPGVSVYIPDLKRGTLTAADGTYKLDKLPQVKVLVQVSLLSYTTAVEAVDLSVVSEKDFSLDMAHKEMHEVIVTGSPQAGEPQRTPTPVAVVPRITLLQTPSSNIIDAIASQPGIAQVSTGTGISKPVIRGLGYNRVVVVNDGIRQEGQQWGDEHGIEIDEFSVHKVEILKGPASLAYGPDALAGVINMISAPTVPEGTVNGNLFGSYQTNNGQAGYSANLAGNLNGFIWDLRYSGKNAHAYQNKYDGYVYGSAFKENSFGGIAGFNKSWGYSHLHFSAYHLQPGIVEGERDSATGKFIKAFALNDTTTADTVVSASELGSYDIPLPHQDIRHYKAVLNSNVVLNKGNIKTVFGFQQNHRQEFANVFDPDEYELYFLLNTFNYDVRYIFPEKGQRLLSAGLNGMYQQSQNKGEESLVPAYDLFDIGGFLTFKRGWEKLDLAGGLRFDSRRLNAETFSRNFSGASGSFGGTYQFTDHLYSKINVAAGFRAPNIAEAGSDGEHEGTGRYDIGDPDLKPENTLQVDYALGIHTQHLSAGIDLFHNTVFNYIFAGKLHNAAGGDSIVDPSNPIPTFKYTQGDASLLGGEVLIDLHPHPLDWLHFESSFACVEAVQKNATDSTRYLPLTPAPKLTAGFRADIKKAGKAIGNAYVKAGVEHYFEQDKFYAAFGTETATPAYTLVNLGLGGDLVKKEQVLCSIFIGINNVTDVAYQNHLSRLKYAAENYVTGRRGVYNMGRNLSFKLLVPIGLKKPK